MKDCCTCTIILRAPTTSLLNECERCLHDALCAVKSIQKCEKIIGGGGAYYLQLAYTLRNSYLPKIRDGELYSIVAKYAESLEIIPKILINNAGFNLSQLLRQAKLAHENGYCYAGLDLKNGTVVKNVIDNTLNFCLIEPSLLAESILKSSAEAAEVILRIDECVMHAPRITAEYMGLLT